MYQKINKISNIESLTIEELYNYCEKYGSAGKTLSGHESVNCPICVMNESVERGVYYADVKRVIRHMVTKRKWEIQPKNGEKITITGDHSVIVYRNGKREQCRPCDIMCGDMLIIINQNNSIYDKIESVSCVGDFVDEYVYDIEMNDREHTFVANNILVHNSVYSQLDEIINSTDWCVGEDTNWKITIDYKSGKVKERIFCGKRTKEEAVEVLGLDNPDIDKYSFVKVKGEEKDFAIVLDDVFLTDYFKKIFDEYAKTLNTENYLKFELESYSDAGIWLCKKKYIQNIRWTDSIPRGDILNNYSKIKPSGIEIVQPSSPSFARKKLMYLVRWIFSHPKFDLREFVNELRLIKDELKIANPDDISWNKKASDYMKWIIDDNKELVMKSGTPITTKGIAYYNYILNNNAKYKNRYTNLSSGMKCKYYYCLNDKCNMFAYEPGMFPIEFAPEIDRNMMFEKTILTPINRIVEAIGFSPIESDLIILKTLKLF